VKKFQLSNASYLEQKKHKGGGMTPTFAVIGLTPKYKKDKS